MPGAQSARSRDTIARLVTGPVALALFADAKRHTHHDTRAHSRACGIRPFASFPSHPRAAHCARDEWLNRSSEVDAQETLADVWGLELACLCRARELLEQRSARVRIRRQVEQQRV
ncbi:MAG: hypothetical protein RL701_7200 [Pseudomonadota bacterium]